MDTTMAHIWMIQDDDHFKLLMHDCEYHTSKDKCRTRIYKRIVELRFPSRILEICVNTPLYIFLVEVVYICIKSLNHRFDVVVQP